MDDVRKLVNLFQQTEEMRGLHDESGDAVVDASRESVEIEQAIRAIADFGDRQAAVFQISSKNFAIFGVNGASDEDFVAARETRGHHGSFRNSRRAIVH